MSKVLILVGDPNLVNKVANYLSVNNTVGNVINVFKEMDSAALEVFSNFPVTVSESQIRRLASLANLGVVSVTKYKGKTLNNFDEAIQYVRHIAVSKEELHSIVAKKILSLADDVFALVGLNNFETKNKVESLLSKSGDKIAWVNVISEDQEELEDSAYNIRYSDDKRTLKANLLRTLKSINNTWNGE